MCQPLENHRFPAASVLGLCVTTVLQAQRVYERACGPTCLTKQVFTLCVVTHFRFLSVGFEISAKPPRQQRQLMLSKRLNV